ncbi:acetyl-CoA carboxylase biotin carboxyl carrier protein subunit [Streptomyces decoyicus]|uniref:acetyl-CoA carboxylase biotin carboxyl carrier protein subunit n=1 Tax=Streptomyces decoyicus TaxID=249567 RepID=UPI0036530538
MSSTLQAVTSDIPALVQEVMAEKGRRVSEGDILLILEAMKMEIPVFAETDGYVAEVHVGAGDLVREEQTVITLAT